MGYRPTLGGLKKAQEFLKLKGHPLPIFQMDVYDGGQLVPFGWRPGQGRTISIDEAIRENGPLCEVVDVRLTNEEGDKYVIFAGIVRADQITGQLAMESGFDVVIYFHKDDPQFDGFMSSGEGEVFVNLARWGKAKVSMFDRIKFRFLPRRYASDAFA